MDLYPAMIDNNKHRCKVTRNFRKVTVMISSLQDSSGASGTPDPDD